MPGANIEDGTLVLNVMAREVSSLGYQYFFRGNRMAQHIWWSTSPSFEGPVNLSRFFAILNGPFQQRAYAIWRAKAGVNAQPGEDHRRLPMGGQHP